MNRVPALSLQQMVDVERMMVEEYHIQPIQTMENAGRSLALLAKRMLDNEIVDRPVVVLAGRGRNGGGGLVAARHLMNWGAWVQILLTREPRAFANLPGHQLDILQRMGLPAAWAEEGWELPPADLIVDAIVGRGLTGEPDGIVRNLIELANSSMAPILSLGVPSGLDLEAGEPVSAHIAASATMALALPKAGLLTGAARSTVGKLYLADIGVPPDLYDRFGLHVPPLFATDTILPLFVQDGQAMLES